MGPENFIGTPEIAERESLIADPFGDVPQNIIQEEFDANPNLLEQALREQGVE